MRAGEIINAANQLIDQEGVGLDDLDALQPLLETPPDLGDPTIESRPEDLQSIGPRPRTRGTPTSLLVELGQQRPAIDDGAAVVNAVHADCNPPPCI